MQLVPKQVSCSMFKPGFCDQYHGERHGSSLYNSDLCVMKHLMIVPLLFATLSVGCTQAQEPRSSPSAGSEQVQNTDLDPASFQERMRAGDAQLIDVRTPAEFKSGHLAGAANLDWNGGDPDKTYADLDKSKPVLVYCAAGGRSTEAMHHLQDQGFDVQQLDGGIASWRKAGLPTIQE